MFRHFQHKLKEALAQNETRRFNLISKRHKGDKKDTHRKGIISKLYVKWSVLK